MKHVVTLILRADDAEPTLRLAAYEAAKFGALCDYMIEKTWDAPTGHGESVRDARKRWSAIFLRAKRIVEAFGVDYSATSEAETLTVHFHYVGGKTTYSKVPGVGTVGRVEGSKPDYDNPVPAYRREVHSYACHAAADRVVRAWRASLERS